MPSLSTSLILTFSFSFSFAALTAAHPTIKRGGPACSNVTIPVTISAENRAVPASLGDELSSILGAANLESLINSIGDDLQLAPVNGTYNLAGLYCEPEVTVTERQNTIQLLVHGITYDHTYWSGGGLPGYDGDKYSWIAYASKLGYPTLSIDRLGCGASDHPDPVTVVQNPVQVEMYHEVIQALRKGDIGGRSFNKVVYVGHSYGSVMGNTLSAKYPTAVDALILTGYSRFLKPSVPGVIITPALRPAALVASRFSDLALGYLAMSSEDGRDQLLFTSDQSEWDSGLSDYDFVRQGTVTVGEAISSLFINDVATDYTNPVLVLTGHKDQIFCGLSLPSLGEANCGEGDSNYMAQTASLYPNAKYTWKDIPDAGHCLNFMYNADISFKAAHDFLEDVGL